MKTDNVEVKITLAQLDSLRTEIENLQFTIEKLNEELRQVTIGQINEFVRRFNEKTQ